MSQVSQMMIIEVTYKKWGYGNTLIIKQVYSAKSSWNSGKLFIKKDCPFSIRKRAVGGILMYKFKLYAKFLC